MLHIQFPPYDFRFRQNKGKMEIFDLIRKKFIAATPEEMVRQNWIHYFIHTSLYPAAKMAVEYGFEWNGMQKRADLLIFDASFQPWLMLECKRPQVSLNQEVARQIATYNLHFKVPFLMISNGIHHFLFRYDAEKESCTEWMQLPEIPN